MPDESRPASLLPGPEELVPWWHRFSPRDLPVWQRYGIAVGLSVIVVILQRWLFETGGNRFALFYVSIVLSAWFGGLGPALLSIVLASVAAGWWLAPIGARAPLTPMGNFAVVSVFVATGLFLTAACQAARRASRRLQLGMDHLKAEIERREAALAAQHSAEAELDGVFRLAGAGMAITEVATGRFLRVNPELCAMLGYTEEEMLKMTYLDATPVPDRAWTEQQLGRFARQETKFLHLENRVLRKNWDVLWVDAIGTELPATRERPRRMVVVLLDATDRMTAEHRLQAADRRKDEFLAMLSHELRNPLGAIRQALRLTEGNETDASTRQWARDVVERQTAQLARMVDDLLDVARFHAGKIRIDSAPVDLAAVMDHAGELVQTLFAEHGHTFYHDYPRELWVQGDAARLEQIFTNLLSNAAKYTDWGGRIELIARAEMREIIVQVRDNGQGMAPEKIAEMFEVFVQGERSLARPEGGLGLGLAIVRQLVDLHGGNIAAESPGPGLGSTFTVALPQILAPLSPTPAVPDISPTISLEGLRILVVDDHQDAARSLARLLERRGAEVAVLHDGLAALHEAAAFAPDTILLDLGLPGLDGYEVARQLRARGDTMQIIAVSGYGTDQDRARSTAAGCDAHLLKPVDFDYLCAQLGTAHAT